MRVVILVPRRNDNGHRDALWSFCKQWWIDNHESMPIYEGHHEHGPFNRSAALNSASEAAGDWDVALIIDSDTISNPDSVQQAIKSAAITGGLVVAHDKRHMMSSRATTMILAGDRTNWQRRGMVQKTYLDSVSCAVAVARKTWDALGGFDDRFSGWGFEDTAFHIACETITGLPIEIVPGDCFHLWHETGAETSMKSITYQRNRALKLRYEAVRWRPDHLLRMIGRADDDAPVGTIPRILHRTVPAETSAEVEEWWQRFGDLHPDWDLRTYREPINPDDWPLTGSLFDRCQNGAQKAGLIRLEALYTHGGVYVDSDVEPYRSFESLLPLPAFAGWEDETTVPDAVMGACPRHPAWEQMIGRARESIMNGQDAWSSGPGGTTEILPGRTDVVLLPPGAFYPTHYLEKNKLGSNVYRPWVFCEHKWHHSWGTPAQLQSVQRNQRNQLTRVAPTPPARTVVRPNVEVALPSDFKIAVCIPWNGTDEPWRVASYKWCVDWWMKAGLSVYVGPGVSRSAMRNEAARRAIADGADVLFFADADTWVPIRQLVDACVMARENRQLVHAFDLYVRLGSAMSKMHQALPDIDISKILRMGSRQREHMSGASAIPIVLWSMIGGYDERFVEWGYEDRAFDVAARCLAGDVGRVPGYAVHWYHAPSQGKERRPPPDDFATGLVVRYCQAAAHVPKVGVVARLAKPQVPTGAVSDPDAMLAILSEPGGPLITESA